MKMRQLVAGALILCFVGLIVGFGLVDFQTPASIPTDSANSVSVSRTVTPRQTRSALDNLAIFYSDTDNNEVFVKALGSSLPPLEVLTDPLYTQEFAGWDWSAKAGAFVVNGPENGLYIYKPGDLAPHLVLDAAQVGYEALNYPSWLPDGKSVVFIANNEKSALPGRVDALMVDTLGQPPKILIGPVSFDNTLAISPQVPRWSPDGRYVAFFIVGLGSTILSGQIALFPIGCTKADTVSCLENLSLADNSYIPPPGTGDANEVYGNPIWSPDGHQFAFSCGESLCVTDYNSLGFTHFKRLNTSCSGTSAWSPDSQNLICADDNNLELIDVKANTETTITSLIAKYRSDQNLAWITLKDMVALKSAPTPYPSPTISQTLELQGACMDSRYVWDWLIINPNEQNVWFTLNVYDLTTGAIEESRVEQVPAAKGSTPGTSKEASSVSPDPTEARLYVNNVLQAKASPNNTRCPTETPNPTLTAQASH